MHVYFCNCSMYTLKELGFLVGVEFSVYLLASRRRSVKKYF